MLFSSPGESADNDFIINTKAANGNITLQGAIDGDWNNFVLKSGSGTITTTSTAPMTQVASLVLQDNTAAATGSVTFNANLLVDWIDTYPQNYSVSFLGTTTEIGIRPYYKYGNAEHPIFYNTAGVRFGDDATDTTLIRDRLTVATATTTVTGVLRTYQRILIGNVNVVNTASIVTVGGGTVWINGSISGSNAEMRFGEGTEGTMSYNVTGNVTLQTLTTFADDTTLTFLEDVTVQTATTLLNTRVQFGDAADDVATFNPGFNATAVPLFSFAGRMLTNSNPISISTVTLLANSEFDTGTGGAAADISIGTVFGTSALTLDTGATAGGSISLASMPKLTGGLTIRDAGDTVTLGTLGLSGSGPITITHAQAGVTFSNDVFATTLTITEHGR
jgi:hypothetical protein